MRDEIDATRSRKYAQVYLSRDKQQQHLFEATSQKIKIFYSKIYLFVFYYSESFLEEELAFRE